jgi:hypothetical protein
VATLPKLIAKPTNDMSGNIPDKLAPGMKEGERHVIPSLNVVLTARYGLADPEKWIRGHLGKGQRMLGWSLTEGWRAALP